MNQCANVFCAFHDGKSCFLPQIHLNEQGVCADCTMIPTCQSARDKHDEEMNRLWSLQEHKYSLEYFRQKYDEIWANKLKDKEDKDKNK